MRFKEFLIEASIYNLIKGHPHRNHILDTGIVKELSHQADFKEAPLEDLSEFPEKYPYDDAEYYIYVLVLGDQGSALLRYDRYYDDHSFLVYGIQTMPNGEVKTRYSVTELFYPYNIVQFLHGYTGENSKMYMALNPGNQVRERLRRSRVQTRQVPSFGESLRIMYKHILPIISDEVPKALFRMQSLYRQAIEQSNYALAEQISQKGTQLDAFLRVKDTGILRVEIHPIVSGIAKRGYKTWALKRRPGVVPPIERWAHNASSMSKPEFNSFVEAFKEYLFNTEPMD
jgi:hypothetical protein